MIRFYRIDNPAVVAKTLSQKIIKQLASGRVLWLVAGGSSINIAIQVSKLLRGAKNLSNLTVSLTDERFGPVGHPDSNWKQLIESGFIIDGAGLLPVLIKGSRDEVVASYTAMLDDELNKSSYSVALAGMGADGHILGIKPNSPSVDSKQLVVGYQWQDHDRITPTVELIKRLDEIIVYAFGAEKHDQLDRIEQEVSAQQQPAQLLKQAKQVSIYNDYKGDKL